MVDVNTSVENPAFVAAMEALQQTPTRDTEDAFFEALKEAHFLMVFEGNLIHDTPDADGKTVIRKNSTMSIPMLSDANGKPLYFLFTDWGALKQWSAIPNTQTLIIPYDQVPDMVLRDDKECAGVLINPATHNFLLPKHIVAFASGRAVQQTVQKDTPITLGEPANYPHDLVNAVKTCLKTLKPIKRAWFMLMSKEGEQSYLLVLDHQGDKPSISQQVGQAALPHAHGMYVDIVTYDTSFGKRAAENRKPFYKRGIFG